MNIFISGGCKNGKSMYAQEIAQAMAREKNVPLYYLATMIPVDGEDRARIKKHLSDREGWGFTTIEQGTDICKALSSEIDPRGVFLLDSVTALLSNEMFPMGKNCDLDIWKKVSRDLEAFAGKTGNSVFVSDYIYSEAKNFDEYTEGYRRGLAAIDRNLARICEEVVEVSFGNRYFYKGKGIR